MQGELVRELNATHGMEADLDYDTVVNAYERVTTDFFYSVKEDHALLVLSQCVHDMSSSELIIKHSAYRALLAFVDFCAQIVNCEEKDNQEMPEAMVVVENHSWTKSSIHQIVEKFIMKHIGDAMKNGATIKKVYVDNHNSILENQGKKLKNICITVDWLNLLDRTRIQLVMSQVENLTDKSSNSHFVDI